MLVCNDGGINHLSVTTKTLTLALFGITDPVAWSPASAFSHHHHLYVPGDWMDDRTFGISAERVLARINELLEDRHRDDATG